MGNLISQEGSNRRSRNPRSQEDFPRFFLARLRRMVAVRREQGPLLQTGELELRLLDKAVYSTFCDCLDLGVGDEARAVLRQEELVAGDEAPEVDPN